MTSRGRALYARRWTARAATGHGAVLLTHQARRDTAGDHAHQARARPARASKCHCDVRRLWRGTPAGPPRDPKDAPRGIRETPKRYPQRFREASKMPLALLLAILIHPPPPPPPHPLSSSSSSSFSSSSSYSSSFSFLLIHPSILPFRLLLLLLLRLLRTVRLSPSLLLHFPHHLNSPGRRFWMGWWGCAKRQEFAAPRISSSSLPPFLLPPPLLLLLLLISLLHLLS